MGRRSGDARAPRSAARARDAARRRRRRRRQRRRGGGRPEEARACDEADEAGAREALARAVAAGTPLLLRGAARGWTSWETCSAKLAAADDDDDALVPVSIVSKDGSTNGLGPLPANLSGDVREWLAARGVRHALMRPTSQYMRLSTFRKLLRGGRCDGRCYLKQLSVEMSLPSLLRCWDPDPQPAGLPPLGDSYLWWGAGGTQTQLHFDRRANLLAVLAGEKHVDLLPPTALQPTPMLDLAVAAGGADGGAAAAPLLPSTPSDASLSHNHFLESAPPADVPRTTCRARADDIVFIPPSWRHSVASVGEEVVAVSFFYGR